MQVELDVELNSKSKTYDRNKGIQLSTRVDGAIRDSLEKDQYFSR